VRGLCETLLLGAVLFCVAEASAAARPVEDGYGLSAEHDRCMSSGDAARGVTTGIVDCDREELDRQDHRLNAAYRKLMAGLAPARRVRLRNAERAWIRERDRRCEKAAEPEAGGTLALILRSSCFASETKERADYLEAYR